MKRFAIGAGILLALIAVAGGVLLFAGVPVGPFVNRFVPEIEAQTGLKVRLDGAARIAIWPELSFTADDVRVSDPGQPAELLRIERVKVNLAYDSLRERKAIVTDISLRRPAINIVEGGQARRSAAGGTARNDDLISLAKLDRISVEDGALTYRVPRERVETKVDAIQLTAQARPNDAMRVVGQGRWDNELVSLTMDLGAGARSSDAQAVPAEFTLNLGGRSASVNGRFAIANRTLKAEGFTGRSGADRFNGAISIDWSKDKPYVAASFGFDRLEWSMPADASAPRPAAGAKEPWSDREVWLTPLRLFDANLRIATNELVVQGIRAASAQLEADLKGGVLSISLPATALHGGRAQGRLLLDASGAMPRHAVQLNISGVDALPLLSEAVSFTRLEGRIAARLSLQSTGASSRAIVRSLGGTAEMFIESGAVRGVDVPKLIRSVSRNILSGWQEQDPERDKTPFSVLGATFRIAEGRAATEDIRLVSDAARVSGKGIIDLNNQTLDFRMEPRLVVAQANQPGAQPVDLGVPVVVKGPWDNPQIYPDVADILQNPEAAYSKLRELGKGLFGMFGAPDPGSGARAPTPGQGATGEPPKAMNDLMQSVDQMFKGSGTQGQSGQQGGFGDLLKGLLKQ
jgi:AsmA protein